MAEEAITKDYVLAKLREILDDPDIKAKDRLSALKMAGDYLKLFNKKLEIDVRKLVAQLTSAELRGEHNVQSHKGLPPQQLEVDIRSYSLDGSPHGICLQHGEGVEGCGSTSGGSGGSEAGSEGDPSDHE